MASGRSRLTARHRPRLMPTTQPPSDDAPLPAVARTPSTGAGSPASTDAVVAHKTVPAGLLAGLGSRDARTAAPFFRAQLGGLDRARHPSGRLIDRGRRMVVRSGGDGPVRRDVPLAGDDQHRHAGLLQSRSHALHPLLWRADLCRGFPPGSRPQVLDGRLSGPVHRPHLALHGGQRRRSVDGGPARTSPRQRERLDRFLDRSRNPIWSNCSDT